MPKGILVLEDGAVFEGQTFGAAARATGEVVFNTAMTGYQEMLTDPSYAGQILVPTYPLQGNYGVNPQDGESRRIQVRGFVAREECLRPSHWQSTGTLGGFLASQGIPGLAGVDTRALTRRLRTRGVMMGTLTSDESAEAALARLRALPAYGSADYVREVSISEPYRWPAPPGNSARRIALLDCGVKHNIMRILSGLGCVVTVVPAATPAAEVLSLEPEGIVLSPGPGDPALLGYAVATVRELAQRKPTFGICLGHQLLGLAFGGRTFKLPFGHRGGNHPVRDLATGRVHITAQNHGYAVDAESLAGTGLEVSQVNLNDGTVEGLRHRDLPLMSIQYHSEASPGPLDNVYLFQQFLDMVRNSDV
ncbi:MAG: glutamine-hydrolyzing carbamoyl-phosphate synthase small subunit [Chloroflexi bacterium]|nr:glutamine-hydrolyzing carbamoyl-phosphate synthase small subunit [Chloroflexota bacterium]